ncbi:hypothetical protein [Enterococcus timonensis]|uniref:hypothetical protein n=1 Tax=Enterococcus timonensis TaxID=1852364 RepID=UPI0008DAB94A|nr:hypothetical protein [Enterococcus timonensis]
MKKFLVLGLLVFSLTACSNAGETAESKNYDEENTEAKETDDTENSRATAIVENVLEEHYMIDDFEVNFTNDSFKVIQMPDDKNAETGEEYKNLYSAIGDYTYQEKTYQFVALYSLKDESDYSVLYFYTPLDEEKSISVPLESEK